MPKAVFLGTYSTRGIPNAGNQPNPASPKYYWFVWEDSIANAYLVQQLDRAFNPRGEPRLLPPKLFRQFFLREPKVTLIPNIHPDVADYLDKVFDGAYEREPSQHIDSHIAPPQQSQGARPPKATPETLDKEMRAEFAQGIMRLRKGQRKAAYDAFTRLGSMQEGIVPAHKHMFTEFGIDLRKSKLSDLALQHFSRAVELSPEDSHANFNMARILYELGKKMQARRYVNKALELDPHLDCAKKLQIKLEGR